MRLQGLARKYMKIAMVGQKRVPSRDGGLEVVVGALAKRMVAQGHSMTCYNRTDKQQPKPENFSGISLKYVPTIQKKGLAAVSASFFGCLCAAVGNYDVVHVHAEGPALFCWLPKLTGKRVIVTVHGLDWTRAKWRSGIASKCIKLGERMAVRWADELIVLSNGMKQYFADTYGRETLLIPNGVPSFQPCEAELIRQYGLEKDNYILYLGCIVPEKGEHYLIQAYKNLPTDKKLVIAGGASDSQEYYDELRELAKGDDRVMFLGFVQGQLLAELYSDAYTYVLPSDIEGMPLSLMEAMSYGNCVLTSDIDECASVVQEHGVTFRHGDIADLRVKLANLLSNPAKVAKYKAEAPDYISRSHNWDTVAQRTLAVYRGAVPQEEPHRDLLPAALAAEMAKRKHLVRGE